MLFRERRGELHTCFLHVAHMLPACCTHVACTCCMHVASTCRQKNMELAVTALVAATLEENGEYSEDSGSDSDGGIVSSLPPSLGPWFIVIMVRFTGMGCWCRC